MDYYFRLSLLFITWLCVGFSWGTVWWAAKHRRRYMAAMEALSGGCAPGTHVWVGSGAAPLMNDFDHAATFLGKLECLRCHEVLPFDIRISLDQRGIQFTVTTGKRNPTDA